MRNTGITPFWRRLPEIARYPLQGAAFGTLVALTFCRLVTYLPFGWLWNLLVWFGMYTYAVAVLRRTADGHMDSQEVGLADESVGRHQVYLQVLFVLAGLGAWHFLGPVPGLAVALLLGLAMPGATMSLAMDENFARALNPLTWLAIFGRLGLSYVAVALLCLAIIACQVAAQVLVSFLPPVVNVLVFYFIAQYLVLVAFHVMGYLIYQHHDALGHEIAPREVRRSLTADPDQGLLDEAISLARDGQGEQATTLLGDHLRKHGGSAALHGQYHKLLRSSLPAKSGDTVALSQHGRDYVSMLLATEQDKRALDVARECLADDPGFTLALAEQVKPMATLAIRLGQTRIALDLLSGFHLRHPRDPDVPANVLLLARLLGDRFGQEAEARALLRQTGSYFSDAELRAERDACLAFLDALGAPARRA